MDRFLWLVANGLATAVILMLVIEPARPLGPVLALLAGSVLAYLGWHLSRKRHQ
jgi:hypothetical protein